MEGGDRATSRPGVRLLTALHLRHMGTCRLSSFNSPVPQGCQTRARAGPARQGLTWTVRSPGAVTADVRRMVPVLPSSTDPRGVFTSQALVRPYRTPLVWTGTVSHAAGNLVGRDAALERGGGDPDGYTV